MVNSFAGKDSRLAAFMPLLHKAILAMDNENVEKLIDTMEQKLAEIKDARKQDANGY